MFESAEIDHKLSDKDYKKEVPRLREALLQSQYRLLENKDKAVLIIVGGVEGAGKGDTINLLSGWLDSRHLDVHALGGEPSDEEARRPNYFRYFRRLPPKGTIGVHFGSWHSQPILKYALGEITRSEMDAALSRVCEFERMLVQEGWVLLKLWFHLSKKQQKMRLETLSKDKKQSWRVTDRDWALFKQYDRLAKVSARALRETSSGHAPWNIIPGADPNYRHISVGRALLAALDSPVPDELDIAPVKLSEPADGVHLLHTLDLSQSLAKKQYRSRLDKLQGDLNQAVRSKKFSECSLALVFEGWDAAGKGGAIRRVTSALDVRTYHVHSVAAPTDEEKLYPYLWRFWRHAPKSGHVAIFDRSWYGRVLVERIEGFCSEADWMRAYKEINEFEEQWYERGVETLKFWLHISPEEQMRRFKEREVIGYKKHKITDEDWRNRDRWKQYEHAITDMVDRTSTEIAPWTLVEAEDKYFARIKVLEAILERLEARK